MFDIIWTPVPFISTQWNNITYNIPSVDDLEKDISALNIVELILLAPSMLLCAYLIFIVHSISLFHRNVFVLFAVAFTWLVIGYLGRFFILLIRMKFIEEESCPGLLFLSSFLRFEYYGNIITIQSTLVGERIFATYFVSDYEKNHRVWIICIVLTLATLITQIFSLSVLFMDTPIILPLGYCVSITLSSFFVLNYLYSSNSKKLVLLKRNPLMYSLSKKFQIEENLRIMWYLRGFLFCFFCGCSLISILLLVPSLFGLNKLTIDGAVRFIDITVVLACTGMPIGMFNALYYVRNPAFLRRHQWLLGEEFSKKRNRVTPVTTNETDEYFGQLNKSWM